MSGDVMIKYITFLYCCHCRRRRHHHHHHHHHTRRHHEYYHTDVIVDDVRRGLSMRSGEVRAAGDDVRLRLRAVVHRRGPLRGHLQAVPQPQVDLQTCPPPGAHRLAGLSRLQSAAGHNSLSLSLSLSVSLSLSLSLSLSVCLFLAGFSCL